MAPIASGSPLASAAGVPLNHLFHRGDPRRPALLLIHPLGADIDILGRVRRDLEAGLSVRRARYALRRRIAFGRRSGPDQRARRRSRRDCVRVSDCGAWSRLAAPSARWWRRRMRPPIRGRRRRWSCSNPALRTSPEARSMLEERARLVRASGMAAILPGAVDRAFIAAAQGRTLRALPGPLRGAATRKPTRCPPSEFWMPTRRRIWRRSAARRSSSPVATTCCCRRRRSRAVHALIPGARFVQVDAGRALHALPEAAANSRNWSSISCAGRRPGPLSTATPIGSPHREEHRIPAGADAAALRTRGRVQCLVRHRAHPRARRGAGLPDRPALRLHRRIPPLPRDVRHGKSRGARLRAATCAFRSTRRVRGPSA